MPLLLPSASVDRQNRRSGLQHILRVGETLLLGVKQADLGGDWHRQLLMQLIDQPEDQILILLQERAVVPLSCDTLGTAQVEVHSVTVWRRLSRRGQQVLWVVRTELNEQWSVDLGVPVEPGSGVIACGAFPCSFEMRTTVLLIFAEVAGVEHGGIRKELWLFGIGEEGS